jgi:hypothetical protein
MASEEEKKKVLVPKINVFSEDNMHLSETKAAHIPLGPFTFDPDEYEIEEKKTAAQEHPSIEISYVEKHTPLKLNIIDELSHQNISAEFFSEEEKSREVKRQRRSVQDNANQLTEQQNVTKIKLTKEFEQKVKTSGIRTLVHEMKLKLFSHREDWVWRHISFMDNYESNLKNFQQFMTFFQKWNVEWGRNNNDNVMDAPWLDVVGDITLIINAYNLHFKEINKIFLQENSDEFQTKMNNLNNWVDIKLEIQEMRYPHFKTLLKDFENKEQITMFNYYSQKPIFKLFKTYVDFFENPNYQEIIDMYETDDIEEIEKNMGEAFSELCSHTNHLYMLMEFIPAESFNDEFFTIAREYVRQNRLKKYIETNFIPKLKKWAFSYTQKETVLTTKGFFNSKEEIELAKGDGDLKTDEISNSGWGLLNIRIQNHLKNAKEKKIKTTC